MRKVSLLAFLLLFLLTISASAFDGQRKGFILGGGLGFAPVAHWEVDVEFFGVELGKANEDKAGVAVQLVIGGAFDEHNVLVYEANGVGFTSDLFLSDETITQGFSGAVWYHYFGAPGKAAFTSLGVGLYVFEVGDYDPTQPGGALLLGGGYEFAPHWQVGAYLTFGKTTDKAFGLEGDFKHSNFSIIVSGIAF